MKATLIPPTPAETEIVYPCLFRYVNNDKKDLVILATDLNTGTVVLAHECSSYRLGQYRETWERFSNKKIWERFEGKVELSND